MQTSFLFADFVWQFCQHLWNRNTCLLWIKAAHGAAICLLTLYQGWAEKGLACGITGTCATCQPYSVMTSLTDCLTQKGSTHTHGFCNFWNVNFFNYWDHKPAGKKQNKTKTNKKSNNYCELLHCCWCVLILHVLPLSITSALKNKMAWGLSDLCPNLPVICCGLKERKQKAVTLASSK